MWQVVERMKNWAGTRRTWTAFLVVGPATAIVWALAEPSFSGFWVALGIVGAAAVYAFARRLLRPAATEVH